MSGITTPNIGIYIPAGGETLYTASFFQGMINVDQHDHSGGPNKGLPIPGAGLEDFSVTYNKLNANVADNTTGIGTAGGALQNQLIILGLLQSIFNISTATGLIAKNGTAATAVSIAGASGIAITNADGSTGNPTVATTGLLKSINDNGTATGFLSQNGAVAAARTLTAGSGITITNGDGAAGDPIISSIDSTGTVLQTVYASTASYITVNAAMNTGSVPVITDGVAVISASITPIRSTSKLIISTNFTFHVASNGGCVQGLFRDATTNAIAASDSAASTGAGLSYRSPLTLVYQDDAVSTSATTFYLRAGTEGPTAYINGTQAGAAFGGANVEFATMIIQEVSA